MTRRYHGMLSKCRDISRATIVADSLAAVATVVAAIIACPYFAVMRCKNRFDPDYDSLPVAGYRDFQILGLIEVSWKI